MANLKESAEKYQGAKSKNIADLDSVPIDMQLYDREGVDKNGEPYKYKVCILNGEDYRVPNSVLDQLKSTLKVNPNVKTIKVSKEGEGLQTKYTVVVLG